MSRVEPGSFGPVADRLLKTLRDANGAFVTKREVLDAIYGASADTPDNEGAVLRTTICRLRKRSVPIECTTTFRISPRR